MTILNQCSVCEEDFASVKSFDDHILSAPSDPTFDCMQVSEMRAAGWEQNDRGRWSSPEALSRAQHARERFATSGLRATADAVDATQGQT